MSSRLANCVKDRRENTGFACRPVPLALTHIPNPRKVLDMSTCTISRRYRGIPCLKQKQSQVATSGKFLASGYPNAKTLGAFVLWPMLFLLSLCVTLVDAVAQNVGDLSPHPYSNNGVGNPFSAGGAYNLNPSAGPSRGPAAPTSPYAWSNVSPKPMAPTVLNRAELFGLPEPSSIPSTTRPSKGPYGITLPGNHPLALGGR